MNHSTNIVWGERGELFLHEKALRGYFCAGVHIILARIVGHILTAVSPQLCSQQNNRSIFKACIIDL